MPLIKPGQISHRESLAFVQSSHLDLIVVNSDTLVRVPNGHVQSQIIVESVVCREIELRQRGLGDVEFHGIWAKNQPEDEDYDSGDEENCEEDLEDEIEDAAAETAAAAVEEAAASAAAAAGTVVGFFRWD